MKRTLLYQIWILFLIYTVWSLASEAVFTGVADIIRDYQAGRPFNSHLPCRTSLWSILVYGVPASLGFTFVDRLVPGFFKWHWAKRGFIYTIGTFASEYAWGDFLEWLTGSCPWQYRDSSIALLRYINPEYFLLWFMFGFSLEWIRVKLLPRIIGI